MCACTGPCSARSSVSKEGARRRVVRTHAALAPRERSILVGRVGIEVPQALAVAESVGMEAHTHHERKTNHEPCIERRTPHE